MKNRPLSFTKTELSLDVATLRRYAEGWLLSCDIDQNSASTLALRRFLLAKLFWFLEKHTLSCCGLHELRQFLAYVTNGHKQPGGRWDNPRLTKPTRPSTVATYHRHLPALFSWLVVEGGLEASPMERIPAPTARADQIQPFLRSTGLSRPRR